MRSNNTSEPWRVGILFSRTGFMAVIEETQLRGTLTAIDEINDKGGINGRPVEPIVYDPGSDSKAYGLYAKKLMVEDGVSTIFGCYTSSSRKAVLPVVERLDGLLWYPTLYEGFEFSSNVIYTGATPNQNSVQLCRTLMELYGTRFYFVGSDYIYPRESNRIMRELIRHSGGSVVGERYVKFGADRSAFVPIMRDIQQVQPDVIFSTVVGEATVFLYQAYADMGLDPKVTPIASLTTSEAEVRAMGFDVGEGHLTAAPYFQGVGNDSNTTFVNRYKKRYGDDEPTNMCLEASYFQVNVFAKTLEKTNSMETNLMRDSVMGSEFDAPQGGVSINPIWGHADLWTRIGRANRQGQFDIVYESPTSVKADPYLIGYGRCLEYS
ncbi:transporter substrate-binding domain-containing protein [Nitratireductor indicus]|uniref:Aliphatic amidase expression-regulating protein AmiC n=1 Tax=Nitratireductor indicus C115 TaxID=1231190 RepID=K2P4A2_9HYPH|nr:transporter substrate-binding domain-containing protein [Nitratireductor indicus]EKF42186.1 aliphatic amidase expression-regulating protein AmiC [Nitratireductor indicus C115]MDS1136264.1 transporter substrate-binding domain-containing protein [Nitratireductor indicus]SFQ61283.1 branched-chain amino acid transport system substrate-binding protein [Nitratireductor indicus]